MSQPKTVVITGASTGIGYACVEASLKAGYHVIATARQQQDLEKLRALGATAIALELDSQASVTQASADILEASDNHIDALFNNAGYGLQIALEDTTWESLEKQHRINVIGPIQLTNLLLPALKPKSKLIFNSSILGVITIPFRGPYCMSKHALESAADAYRLELEPLNINVHVIQPGPIEANFRANADAEAERVLQDKTLRLNYQNHFERLKSKTNTKGTQPASKVADIFCGIVEGKLTKPRYLVTPTAKNAAFMKRLLGHNFHGLAKRAEPVTPA